MPETRTPALARPDTPAAPQRDQLLAEPLSGARELINSEPFPADDPRLQPGYWTARIETIRLPVTALQLEDSLDRCDDCGYLATRCGCRRIEYRGHTETTRS